MGRLRLKSELHTLICVLYFFNATNSFKYEEPVHIRSATFVVALAGVLILSGIFSIPQIWGYVEHYDYVTMVTCIFYFLSYLYTKSVCENEEVKVRAQKFIESIEPEKRRETMLIIGFIYYFVALIPIFLVTILDIIL
ncbi:hypothetical protein C0W92_15195 [Photobacterium angustum]|nr:hypothetical protein UA69_21140 [Photobacterium angustum]PSW88683.1 hypothetical protein C0W92_15195 [Photobacterium angustum]